MGIESCKFIFFHVSSQGFAGVWGAKKGTFGVGKCENVLQGWEKGVQGCRSGNNCGTGALPSSVTAPAHISLLDAPLFPWAGVDAEDDYDAEDDGKCDGDGGDAAGACEVELLGAEVVGGPEDAAAGDQREEAGEEVDGVGATPGDGETAREDGGAE